MDCMVCTQCQKFKFIFTEFPGPAPNFKFSPQKKLIPILSITKEKRSSIVPYPLTIATIYIQTYKLHLSQPPYIAIDQSCPTFYQISNPKVKIFILVTIPEPEI